MKRGYALLVVIAAILWSLDALIRRQLHSIPPTTLVMYEHLLGVIFVLPWLSRFIPQYKKLKLKEWLIVILASVIGGAMATILYTAALARMYNNSYSMVVLLQQLQPIFAIILAALILKEKIRPLFALFASIALVAAYFLTFPDYKPVVFGHQGELSASVLAILAAASWGSATVLGKYMLNRLSFAALTVLRFIIVVPAAFILSLFFGQSIAVTNISLTQWGGLVILAVFSQIAAFLIYYRGLQYTEAKVATVAEMACPVAAAFIGYFFLKDRLTVIQILAAVVLLLDIVILSLTSPKKLDGE